MVRRSETYDLVVIGGGIIGVMTALIARRRHPDLGILLLDRSVVGMGATAYSAFLDLPYSSTETGRALSRRSMEIYQDMRTSMPSLPIVDMEMVGLCSVDHLPNVLSGLTQANADALPTYRDDERGGVVAGAIDGLVMPPGHVAVSGIRASRALDGGPLAELVRALQSTPNTQIVEGADVAKISRENDTALIAFHDGRTVRARHTALCIGPWFSASMPDVTRATAAIRVKKVVSLLILEEPSPEATVVYLFDHDAFFMPQPERRRWLFSFRSEDWDCGVNPDRLRLNAQDLDRATSILATFTPGKPVGPLGARIFCDGYTASREPHIALLPDLPAAVAIGGAGGSGVRLAPAMAERGLDQIGL